MVTLVLASVRVKLPLMCAVNGITYMYARKTYDKRGSCSLEFFANTQITVLTEKDSNTQAVY